MTASTNAPYGPETPAIRRFLMSLAGLGAEARATVVASHRALSVTPRYRAAETLLGATIERAGRGDAQDALAGPLLQLVRTKANSTTTAVGENEADALDLLDPIAEPALAALLALLVADLLPATDVNTLLEPFANVIERA